MSVNDAAQDINDDEWEGSTRPLLARPPFAHTPSELLHIHVIENLPPPELPSNNNDDDNDDDEWERSARPLLSRPPLVQTPSELLHIHVVQNLPPPELPGNDDCGSPSPPPPPVEDADTPQPEPFSFNPTTATTVPSSSSSAALIDEYFRTQAELHGWIEPGRMPTTNPFLLRLLCDLKKNPWESRVVDQRLQTPEQLSGELESAYMDQRSLLAARAFRPREGDTIVCGCIRSGQTPVLQIVASLRAGDVIPSKSDLLRRVSWVESTNPYYVGADAEVRQGRILKTHLSVRSVFGGQVQPERALTKKKFKVIVMLRDPMDIRLSWFRHVRRVYKKFSAGSAERFDQTYTSEDFARVRLYSTDANKNSMFEHDRDYEDFLFETMADAETNPDRILVCFYEELLVNPFEFTKKIAEFMQRGGGGGGSSKEAPELDFDLLDRIALSLTEDEDFPHGFFASTHRVRGSSGRGRRYFSPKSHVLQREAWKNRQSVFCSAVASYEDYVLAKSTIIQRQSALQAAGMVAIGGGSGGALSSSTSPHTSLINNNNNNNNGGGNKRSSRMSGRLTLSLRKRTTALLSFSTGGSNSRRNSEDGPPDASSSPPTSPQHHHATLLAPPPLSAEELASKASIELLYGKKDHAPAPPVAPRLSLMMGRKSTLQNEYKKLLEEQAAAEREEEEADEFSVFHQQHQQQQHQPQHRQFATLSPRHRATEAPPPFKPPRADPDDSSDEEEEEKEKTR